MPASRTTRNGLNPVPVKWSTSAHADGRNLAAPGPREVNDRTVIIRSVTIPIRPFVEHSPSFFGLIGFVGWRSDVKIPLYLSRTDQRTAKRNSLRITTANANKVLSDRSSSMSDRETAVSALLAIDWNSDLAREVGSRPRNHLFCLLRNEELPGSEYRIFADTIAHAADESNPIEHPNWL